MLSLLKYTLMKICSLWKILPTGNDTIFHYTVFELWAYVSVIARKISWTPESKLVQVMEVFQNNHFLSSNLLINIVYFYPKMQGKFFVQKCKASFFDAHFLVLIFLLLFVATVIQDHTEICFSFSNMHTWKNIWKNSVIWAPGHNASETL